jgi:hypothetical protein
LMAARTANNLVGSGALIRNWPKSASCDRERTIQFSRTERSERSIPFGDANLNGERAAGQTKSSARTEKVR